MECRVLREEMMEVLYGEASAATIRVVEKHAAGCDACRDELAALRRLRQDLGSWRLPEGAVPRSHRSIPAPWLWPLAAAALLVGLGAALGFTLAEARLGRLLDARDARQQEEIQALRAEVKAATPRADAAVLERVEARIRQSEARQAVFLREQLAEVTDRTEAQRRYDLARVSAGLSYLDGKTGQTVARTTELMGYVLQASQKR
jgi:multidrug efflux pump subunit AcrA (membrane-fusion protein)